MVNGGVNRLFERTPWEVQNGSTVDDSPGLILDVFGPDLASQEGDNILEVGQGSLVFQNLDEVYEADSEYILTVFAGNGPGTEVGNLSSFFLVDGVSNAEGSFIDAHTAIPANSMAPFEVRLSTVARPTAVGRNIRIQLTSSGGSSFFDRVSLRKIPASAGTFVVTNKNDSGPGSLRDAIECAKSGSSIFFDSTVFSKGLENVITPLSPLVVDGKDLAIVANNIPGGVRILGDAGNNRLSTLTVSGGGGLVMESIEFNGGLASNGGAISVATGSTLAAGDCLFMENEAILNGAGGAILAAGEVTLTNCTFTANRAGGGAAVFTGRFGDLWMRHCTVTGNDSSNTARGAVAGFDDGVNLGAVRLFCTVVSDNTALDLSGGGLVSQRGNVIGTMPSGLNGNLPVSARFLGSELGVINPRLMPLAANGGTTRTMYPAPDSPVTDAGIFSSSISVVADARGVLRSSRSSASAGAVMGGNHGTGGSFPAAGAGSQRVTLPQDLVRAVAVSNSPTGEGPREALDGDANTKYLNFTSNSTGLRLTPTLGSTRLSSLALTSANDAPRRDPAIVSVIGHQAGQADKVLVTSSVTFSGRGQARQINFFDLTAAYESFSVLFLALDNDRISPNGAPSSSASQDAFPQIAEIDLRGLPDTNPSTNPPKMLSIEPTGLASGSLRLSYIGTRGQASSLLGSPSLPFNELTENVRNFIATGFVETTVVTPDRARQFYRVVTD